MIVTTSFLIFCIVFSDENKQGTPSAQELNENWIAWVNSIRSIDKPYRLDYSQSNPFVRSQGFEQEEVLTWCFGDKYYCRERSSRPNKVTSDFDPFIAILYQPAYYAEIKRKSLSDGWVFSSTELPTEVTLSQLSFLTRFCQIPGSVDSSEVANLQKYSVRELRRNDSEVRLSYEINQVVREDFVDGAGSVDRFEVTFQKLRNWLPSQIDRHYVDGFWYCGDFEDWKTFDLAVLPTKISYFESTDRSGTPFTTILISQFREVSSKEVEDRCKLSFYGLPEISLDSSFARFTWFALTVIVLLAAMMMGRKYIRLKYT